MKKQRTLYELLERESISENISKNELAKRIGITYQTLMNTKKLNPTRETYNKIAAYFDIDVIFLLDHYPADATLK